VSTFRDLAHPWVEGLTAYEPGRPIEEVARELGFADVEEIVKLASNENPLGPSPRALRAMRAAAPRMHIYPDGDAFALREALARKWGVAPDQLLATNGSNEAIELLGHVFLGPGRSIVMADHAFVIYRLVAASLQAQVISAPMRHLRHDVDALLAAITPATRLVFIDNPDNPTGTMVDKASIDRLIERVPDHVVVVLDEAYVELIPPERRPDAMRYVREGRKVCVLRSFSKSHGLAGLRIGCAVAPAECIRLLHRVRQPFNVNAMAQAAARAAVEDDAHVERFRRLVRRELAFLERELRRLGVEAVPSVVNFLLVKAGRGRALFQALQRRKVIVRPLDGYGLPEYVRVTVGTRAQNLRFVAALQAVLAEGGAP